MRPAVAEGVREVRAYEYSSAFAREIEGFIAFKASMGTSSGSRNWHLYDFDRWCVAVGAGEFSKSTVEGWVLQRREKTSPDHASWMSHIRELVFNKLKV